MRGFNRCGGSQAGANRFAPAGKTGEVMETNCAGNYDLRKFFQRAIYFDGHAPFHCSDLD